MNTGKISWTIEETGKVTSYTYSKLTSGSWIFGVTSYGAKVELLNSSVVNNNIP